MTTYMHISKTSLSLAFAGISLLSLVACDKQRDEPPAQVALPEPTPPPAASTAEPAAAVPSPVPTAPVRVGVAKGSPGGFVVDGWVAGGQCNIESVGQPSNGSKPMILKNGVHTSVIGWALDPEGKTIPDAVHIRFLSKEGDYYGTVAKRLVRDDVNSTHPVQSKTVQSGIEMEFDTDQLPLGNYTVTMVMLFGDKAYICDNGRKVTRVQ
jgi:hypothetical protein